MIKADPSVSMIVTARYTVNSAERTFYDSLAIAFGRKKSITITLSIKIGQVSEKFDK